MQIWKWMRTEIFLFFELYIDASFSPTYPENVFNGSEENDSK
jgi:hypothetical protein